MSMEDLIPPQPANNPLGNGMDSIPVIRGMYRDGERLAIIPHPAVMEQGFVHRHDFIEIAYLESGTCLMHAESEDTPMIPGDFCVLDTNVSHDPRVGSPDTVLTNITIQREFFDEAFFSKLYVSDMVSSFFARAVYSKKTTGRCLFFRGGTDTEIARVFQQLKNEYEGTGYCRREMTECLLQMFIFLMVRLSREQAWAVTVTESDSFSALVPDIIGYIDANFLTVTRSSAAAHFGYSYSHFSTMLKKATGLSFTRLRTTARIRHAESLLADTDLPVTEVAAMSGFTNITSFYEDFREIHSMTPMEYRARAASRGKKDFT